VLLLTLDTDTLDLSDYDSNGLFVDKIDLGTPKVRDVTWDLVDRDGTGDETAYIGSRVISLSGQIIASATAGTRQEILDRLRRFCHPATRPTLTIALNDDVPRVIGLRPDQCGAPIDTPGRCPFAATWVAPDPYFYDTTSNTVTTYPAASASSGRVYNLVFPRVYPSGWGGAGYSTVSVAGDMPTWATFTIYGPCTNPVVSVDTGCVVAFASLTLGSTDYVTIDTLNRLVWLNGDPTADRYTTLDVTRTTWAPLLPDENTVSFSAPTVASPAQLVTEWTDAYY